MQRLLTSVPPVTEVSGGGGKTPIEGSEAIEPFFFSSPPQRYHPEFKMAICNNRRSGNPREGFVSVLSTKRWYVRHPIPSAFQVFHDITEQHTYLSTQPSSTILNVMVAGR